MPIYKDRKTGTWYIKTYYTDFSGNRRQKMKRGFKLQRDAKEWERDFLKCQQGTPDMTFQALCDIYIEDMSHRLRQYTIDIRKNVLKNHILPFFKNKPVNLITPNDIRIWQNQLTKAGFSPSYQLNINKTLSIILNYAVKYYNLPDNPSHKAGYIGKPGRSLTFWTLSQYDQVLKHVDRPDARIGLQVLFYSGMRIGEMLALNLDDFDFTQNTIQITKSLQRKSKSDLITPPKTENSIRSIAMPASIMQEVQEYARRLYGIQASDRVFLFSGNFLRRTMRQSAEKAGIPPIRIHDLRHSHVSLLINMGFTPHLIAERIGDTVQMVNNTYGHLYPSRHDEVARKLNQILVSK